MIHAFLIHTNREDSSEGTADHHHGPNFHAKMNEIRTLTGLNITVNQMIALTNIFLFRSIDVWTMLLILIAVFHTDCAQFCRAK